MLFNRRQTGLGTIVLAFATTIVAVHWLVAAPPVSAAYGGVNGRIVYGSNPSTTAADTQIATILPNGSGRKVLTHTPPGVSSGLPTWSSDGRLIYFGRNPGKGNAEIFVMRRDGSHVRQLTDNPHFNSIGPSPSPDGSQVVYERQPVGGQTDVLMLINANGGTPHALTNPVGVAFAAHWSPDGSRVAFTGFDPNHGLAVYTIAANGTDLRRVTPFSLQGGFPDYSPDGSTIVFTGGTFGPHSQLFTVASGGGHLKVLTDPASGRHDYRGRFSPQGNKIVFVSDRRGCCDLWTMNATGGHLVDITPGNPPIDDGPSWGPALP